jgi:hypothetical protein
MNFVALLILAAFAQPGATSQGDGAREQPKEEKRICKRIDATESRMASKRVCKTAKQWKDSQWSDGDFKDLSRDSRMRTD